MLLNSRHWLAFDIGTTGAKAALIDQRGLVVRSAYRDYATHAAEGSVVEQNAADWWRAVVETTHELIGGDGESIEAIALTGQMQDVVLIDVNGEAVRPVILYSDARAQAEADEVISTFGADYLRELTGNDQGASGLLAKLLWLLYHEPESLTRSVSLLTGGADFVAYRLTGKAISDTTTASTTGLLDISTRKWLGADIFETLGLKHITLRLPEVQPGGAQAGTLSHDAAQSLGLRAGIPVYHGPGDAGATTIGVGSGEPGQVYAYVGTSGWVAFTSGARIAAETGVFTLAHPHPNKYIYVAPLLTAGGNLDWARELFGIAEYSEMIDGALAQPPTKLLYLPYLNGERSPFSDPFARGAFIGLNARHTRADLCRAVLEGVVYAYRHARDALISGPTAAIAITGGGSQSRAWCQLFADITHTPIHIAGDASNVGVRGAALAAQVAAGVYPDYAPPGYFPIADTLQPDSTHRAHYDQQYGLFRAAYPALKGIFARMQP